MRLFVAVELPPLIKAALAEVQGLLKQRLPPTCVGWTRPDTLHLTLRFLGNVPEAELAKLKDGLARAVGHFHSLPLTSEQLGCFPDRRFPRVLWAGIHGPGLSELQAAVSAACEPFAEKPDDKRFTGHITLGRFRHLRPADAEQVRQELKRLHERRFGTWTAGEVILFRSELRPDGARHEPVFSWNLQEPGPGV